MQSDKNIWFERISYLWPIFIVTATVFIGYGSWSTKAQQISELVVKTVEKQDELDRRIIPVELAVKEIPEMRAELKRILEIVISLQRRD